MLRKPSTRFLHHQHRNVNTKQGKPAFACWTSLAQCSFLPSRPHWQCSLGSSSAGFGNRRHQVVNSLQPRRSNRRLHNRSVDRERWTSTLALDGNLRSSTETFSVSPYTTGGSSRTRCAKACSQHSNSG